MSSDQEANTEIVREIRDASDKYVLRRRLGNLLLGARETLEQHAAAMDKAKIETIREIGVTEIVRTSSKKKKKRRRKAAAAGPATSFRIYTVRIELTCGIHDVVRLLHSLESGNPYLCVSSLAITGQAGMPADHRVTIEVQWPIWADPDVPIELWEQIEEGEEAEEEEPPEEEPVEPKAVPETAAATATPPAAERGPQ